MKNTITITGLLFFCFLFAQAQKEHGSFTIQGTLSETAGINKVVLLYPFKNKYIIDTVVVTDQKFSFSGAVPYPTHATLKYISADKKTTVFPFFLENSAIKAVVSNNQPIKTKMTGSASNDIFSELQLQNDAFSVAVLNPLVTQAAALKETKDTLKFNKVKELFLEKLNQGRKEVYLSFVKANPKSPLVYYCLMEGGGIPFNPEVVKPFFYALDTKAKQSEQGLAMLDVLESGIKVRLGAKAPNFTLKNKDNQDISLASLKGRYVLIDFWASWCIPCRQEVPNVLQALQTYQNKGFEVLAVSIDAPTARDKWIKAIETDKSSQFKHVINVKGAANDVAVKYGVNKIPKTFLINPEGIIIETNLRGDELQKKLSEIFK